MTRDARVKTGPRNVRSVARARIGVKRVAGTDEFDILSPMSWWSIAAELVKGAMNARPAPPRPPSEPPPEGANIVDLIQEYRAEVDRGFDALSKSIREQNERSVRALRLQRRWNYGLLAGLVVVGVVMVVLYLKNAP